MKHGTRSGNVVYHWKHGWIPLDHFAALSKAHHSRGGAVKVMQKHGIDVPKGYSSDHKPSAPNVKDTHPLGATVRASQPGIDNQIHGRIVGHAPNGMVQVAHTGHGGKPLIGVFNPSHTHVTAAGAATPHVTPHAEPHTLKPGEHATVRGIDHMGQPMTLTGKVMSNGEVSSFSKGRTTGGQPLRSISVERQDGSRRQNVVYVPDPTRGEQRRGAAASPSAHEAKAAQQAARATQLREAAAKKRAEADRIANGVGAPDRAGAMLRAKDSARMNARMDSGLRRFTEAQRQAKALESKAHLAEGRAKEAARPRLSHEDIKGATHVQDQFGWHEVVRVNAKSVTVKTPYSWTDTIPHEKVHKVLRATPAQIAAAHARAAAKK